jgi:hypothetical protein
VALSALVVRLYGAVVGLLICALGLALLFDFKGFASWHAKLTHAMFGARVRRWPWQFSERGMRIMDRAFGAVFAVLGLVVFIGSIFGHVTMD